MNVWCIHRKFKHNSQSITKRRLYTAAPLRLSSADLSVKRTVILIVKGDETGKEGEARTL